MSISPTSSVFNVLLYFHEVVSRALRNVNKCLFAFVLLHACIAK